MPASPQRRTRRVAPATPGDKPASQLRRVQSATAAPEVRLTEDERATEAADGSLYAPIAGKRFRLADSMGLMPLMQWAASQEGVDTGNVAQLVSFYKVLKDLVHPDDWQAFCDHTCEAKCGDAEFSAFQSAAMEAISARPTGEPATS